MQLGSKETENERFAHYLTKSYRKTASLMANTLKAVSFVFIYQGASFQGRSRGRLLHTTYNIFNFISQLLLSNDM